MIIFLFNKKTLASNLRCSDMMEHIIKKLGFDPLDREQNRIEEPC